MKFSTTYAQAYLTQQEYDAYATRHADALAIVDRNAYESDMLGWVDVDEWANADLCSQIKTLAAEIREKADVFVVVGLGGSNQAARAVIDALTPQDTANGGRRSSTPRSTCPVPTTTTSSSSSTASQSTLTSSRKNFKTLEPGLTFRMLRHYLEDRYGKEEAARRIITTPTVGDKALHRISEERGYRYLPFPENVGGRYSAFTPVGLLPMAVAGVDIDKLLDGAREAERQYRTGGALREQAKQYALTRNALMEKGYGIESLSFFEPQLAAFGRWWRQLFAESEGKNHTALYPIVCSFSEDLHSVGQYLQQGKRQIVETFLHINTPPVAQPIDSEPVVADGFNYLDGKTFHDLNECAYQATVKAHSEGGVPCFVLELEKLDARNVGMLLYFYFIVCYYSAVMLGVDPFDQPGVENYKQEMFRLLGAV